MRASPARPAQQQHAVPARRGSAAARQRGLTTGTLPAVRGAACVSWRESKANKWEAGDAKLKATYPTRAELDGWLDKQCQASKDKSLWKRTRAAKKKAAQAAEGGAAQAAALKKPALTREGARELLTAALDAFKQPANKEELLAIVAECDALGPEQAGMMKMVKLMPAVQSMLGPALTAAGFKADDLMTVAMQIQAFSGEDPSIAIDVSKLMQAVQGDLSGLM